MRTRAIVLGGGGVTGIAWEVGVLAGLASDGVDLRADAIFGTSAGAFVGAALAGGADLEQRYVAQTDAAADEPSVRVPRTLLAAWIWAYARGFRNPERIGIAMGAIARRRSPLTDAAERRRVVAARLTTEAWPDTLRVTAINARSGSLRAFQKRDGVPLLDAVSASGAVPGISPPVNIAAEQWIDGGMVSSANALLATGFDDVLVLAPLPSAYGGVPGVHRDVASLRATSTVHLIVPDPSSQAAIGPNIYDPARRSAAAAAGRAQAHEVSNAIREWAAPSPGG